MPATEEVFQNCESCGASIYPEHLQKHTADRWNGKLLCCHCLMEQRDGGAADPAAIPFEAEVDVSLAEPVAVGAGVASGGGAGTGAPPAAQIRAFGSSGSIGVAGSAGHRFRRALAPESPHATRCRTFHAKLADAAIVHMNEQINEWVDANDDVAVKFATSTIGVVEGKHSDPHLIVTVFY